MSHVASRDTDVKLQAGVLLLEAALPLGQSEVLLLGHAKDLGILLGQQVLLSNR